MTASQRRGQWCSELSPPPRISALRIGLTARVYGGVVGMVNIGSHAPTCPPFILRCVRGGPLTGAPNQGACIWHTTS
jgi:hypothetical protein